MIQALTSGLVLTLLTFSGGAAQVHDRVSEGQWFHQFLRTAEAFPLSKGEGIKVAIIDSGVDASHQDLDGSVLVGRDFITPLGGDGRTDLDGHGTAMAGLVAAHGRVSGVAPGAQIIPVRVGVRHETAADLVSSGIDWAINRGVSVMSLAWSTKEIDPYLRQAVDKAIQSDIVFVAGVGNTPDTSVGFPAKISGVLAVAGVDQRGNRSRVSVAGPEVDIAAPSDNISSTDKGGGYREGTGTSDATAIVAGAVALVRARYPQLKAPEVIRRLTATATDKGAPGRDDEYGHGVLNIVAALTAELPGETAAPSGSGSATGVRALEPEAPPGGARFPWWVLAVLPTVGVVGIIWLRRRRTERYSTGE